MRFAYDKMYITKKGSKSECQLADSNNMEHAIAILSEPLRRRKSRSQQRRDRLLKMGKVVCTSRGLQNPLKLDISNVVKKKS